MAKKVKVTEGMRMASSDLKRYTSRGVGLNKGAIKFTYGLSERQYQKMLRMRRKK
jgi:hypothetical protein